MARLCTTGCSSRCISTRPSAIPPSSMSTAGPGVQRVARQLERQLVSRKSSRAPATWYSSWTIAAARFAARPSRRPSTIEAGRRRGRRSGAGRALARLAELRRSDAHRRVGMELWRLHDADADVQGARCVSRRRRGRARDRLGALRHALHRALSGSAAGQSAPATRRAPCCPTPRIFGANCW